MLYTLSRRPYKDIVYKVIIEDDASYESGFVGVQLLLLE